MPETRARPARERERFICVARANAWFYTRMCRADDPCWDVMDEWRCQSESVKIRRWRAANPTEMPGESQEDSKTDAIG